MIGTAALFGALADSLFPDRPAEEQARELMLAVAAWYGERDQ